MDNTKLNSLAARAMGFIWTYDPEVDAYFWYEDGEFVLTASDWNPAGCADDALVLIDKVCEGEQYRIIRNAAGERGKDEKYTFGVGIYPNSLRYGNNFPMAVTLCALRASPEVTEEQIQEAMK